MDDKPAQGQSLPPLPTPIKSGPDAPVAPLPPPAQPESVPPPPPPPNPEFPPIVPPAPSIVEELAEIQPDESVVLSDTPPPPEMESAQIPPGPPQSGEVTLTPPPPEAGNAPVAKSGLPGGPKLFVLLGLAILIIVLLGKFVFLKGEGSQPAAPSEAPNRTVRGEVEGPTPSIVKTAPLTLLLTSPAEGEVATASSILIKGSTAPNAAVVFLTDKNFESTESGTTGSFSGSLNLSQGTNDILIVAVNGKGESKSESRKVIFGTDTADASASLLEATGSALIRGKMQAIPGIITGINGAIVTILDKSQNDTFYNIKVASASAIRLSGSEKAGLSALSLGQAALAVAAPDGEGNLVANLIHAVAK